MTTLQPTRTDQLQEADPNDLVVRARGGCEESFTELTRRYFPRLVQLIRPRISGSNYMDAEDIAQESLARAFQKLDGFDPKYRFSTWLYTIAVRLAMDHNRGTRRRLNLLETHRSISAIHTNSQVALATTLEHRDAADAVWEIARSALAEPYYTAMWLRFAEDLSVEEIAKVMRKTKVGVRVLLHRARTKMLSVLNMEESLKSAKNSPSRTSKERVIP